MIISGTHRELDKGRCAQRRERSVHGVEQRVCGLVIRRLNPLTFEHSPERLRYVKMRGIRGQEEKIETSFSHISLISFMSLLRCTLALSSTMNVSFLIVRENLSRKSAIFSDVILSMEEKP